MKGIARTYDHVTPEMRRQILNALETRWQAALDGLTEKERGRLESWFPHLRADREPDIAGGSRSTNRLQLIMEDTEKPSLGDPEKGSLTCTNVLVDLLRRYLNRPDLLGPLVDVVRRIHDPAEGGHEKVTAIEGRTASPDYIRRRLSDTDIAEVIRAYLSGTTARALAEAYGVSLTTIRNKLREHGTRRDRLCSTSEV